MGTDIHGVFQRYVPQENRWEDIPSDYDEGRDYLLFSVLADVRNGYSFAGVRLGDPLEPISTPRGFPEDFEFDESEGCHRLPSVECLPKCYRTFLEERTDLASSAPLNRYMGDHSYSWLSGSELLLWYAEAPQVRCCSVINQEEYGKWDKTSEPESCCGDISGPRIRVVSQEEVSGLDLSEWTHVRVWWVEPLATRLAYFFNEVQRLVNEHVEIRFVFGFDS